MNKQSSLFREETLETIGHIFQAALREDTVWEARLLDGGMFNTTYFVEYGADHKKAVLRLGPVNRQLLMGYENNLIEAEVSVYEACQKAGIPCSRVLASDAGKAILDRDFMIVEYIPSVAMSLAKLSKEQKTRLYAQMGSYLARLHQISCESFGFVSRILEGHRFARWSDALLFEVEDISARMERAGGLSSQEIEAIKELFAQNRALLDEIKVPSLLHTDLWEGNVLLDGETLEIVALIDGDRAVFGDPDFEFSSGWMQNPALTEGYGAAMQGPVSEKRAKRRRLYQLFYCLMNAYVWLAEYNNQEYYENDKGQLLNILEAERQ